MTFHENRHSEFRTENEILSLLATYVARFWPNSVYIFFILFEFFLSWYIVFKKTDELVPSATTDLLKPVLALHRNISCLEFLYLSITRVWPSVTVFVEFVPLRLMTSDIDNLISSSRWHYSPRWALASSTISLQASRFLALSLHSFTLIFLMSMDTSSSHLIFGLPLRLVAYSFPYIFFGFAVSCILPIWPSHRILWHLINLTIFSPLDYGF